jgi:hypothetical protein
MDQLESFKSPSFLEIQAWLREKEEAFFETLRQYGSYTGKGTERFKKPKKAGLGNSINTFLFGDSFPIFTGSKLCGVGTQAVFIAADIKFGDNSFLTPVLSNVNYLNLDMDCVKSILNINSMNPEELSWSHCRLHMVDNKDKKYVIDPTFGQINRRLNRIGLFRAEDEPFIYNNGEEIVYFPEYPQTFYRDIKSHLQNIKEHPNQYSPFQKLVKSLL